MPKCRWKLVKDLCIIIYIKLLMTTSSVTDYIVCSGRSQDRHFRTDGALTYIFKRSPPVQMPSMPFKRQMAEITADGKKYLTESDIAHKFNM